MNKAEGSHTHWEREDQRDCQCFRHSDRTAIAELLHNDRNCPSVYMSVSRSPSTVCQNPHSSPLLLLGKTLMVTNIEGRRRRRWQRMRWLDASPTQWTWVWANSGREWSGKSGTLHSMGSQRAEHDLATKPQPQAQSIHMSVSRSPQVLSARAHTPAHCCYWRQFLFLISTLN